MKRLLGIVLSIIAVGTFQANGYAQEGEQSFSPSFALTGELASTTTFELTDLQALPAQELEVTYSASGEMQRHTYTGVLLYDLLTEAQPAFDTEVNNDVLSFYVRVEATDGYVTTVSWGELDPDFGNQAILVAYEEDGELMQEDGMARLVVPGDERGGRYISNISNIALLRAATP